MKKVRNSTRVRIAQVRSHAPIALIGLLLLALIAMGVYADDAVRNAKITDAEGSDGLEVEVVEGLEVGALLFTDRAYTITEIPEPYQGLPWIRTSNNSKKSANVEISFNIDREAYIYLAWDPGTPGQPWLADYTLTGDTINTSDAPKGVYKSNNPFPPGEVKTYEAVADAGFYTIIVEGIKQPGKIERWGKLARTWGSIKAQ